tara:strand:+ start:402 stop:923 length:522 start_codon:yes stop_codon:yes gene_type:complete
MTSKLKVNLINDSGDNNLITSDGSGKITASKFSYGQVAMNTADLNITIGSTSYAEISTDLRLTLTPNSTSSKFIYSLNGTVFTNNNNTATFFALYKSTDGGGSFSLVDDDIGKYYNYQALSSNSFYNYICWFAKDEPSTTNSIIYTPYAKYSNNSTNFGNGGPVTCILREVLP